MADKLEAFSEAWKRVSDALDDVPGGMHADLEDAASEMWNVIDAFPPADVSADGWMPIETAPRDCETEIDLWCESAEGGGWNLRGLLYPGEPDWVKRDGESDYWPHENGGFLTHWRPLPAPPVASADGGGE